MLKIVFTLFLLIPLIKESAFAQNIFFVDKGNVKFLSEAPLETIQAQSDKLSGVINTTDATFAFSFLVNSFQGFNSPLQKEHFNEHYLETENYPKATFVGKMIGWADGATEGNQSIIAKGKFTIKDVTRIVTIPVALNRKTNGSIDAQCAFEVLLVDYDINVPIILNAKISKNIKVTVSASFVPSDE